MTPDQQLPPPTGPAVRPSRLSVIAGGILLTLCLTGGAVALATQDG
jgi:hypothetical protein